MIRHGTDRPLLSASFSSSLLCDPLLTSGLTMPPTPPRLFADIFMSRPACDGDAACVPVQAENEGLSQAGASLASCLRLPGHISFCEALAHKMIPFLS